MSRALAVAALLLSLAAPAAAQTMADEIVNTPGLGAVTVTGLQQPPKVIKDAKVQGGQALRIAIPGADKDVWRISLGTPIVKAVKKGDRLVLAFYARVEHADQPTVTLPYNAVQLSHEPWTAVFSGPVTIGPDWKMVSVTGTADRDHPANDLMVSVHLATGKQVLNVGPVFVLDLGPAH